MSAQCSPPRAAGGTREGGCEPRGEAPAPRPVAHDAHEGYREYTDRCGYTRSRTLAPGHTQALAPSLWHLSALSGPHGPGGAHILSAQGHSRTVRHGPGQTAEAVFHPHSGAPPSTWLLPLPRATRPQQGRSPANTPATTAHSGPASDLAGRVLSPGAGDWLAGPRACHTAVQSGRPRRRAGAGPGPGAGGAGWPALPGLLGKPSHGEGGATGDPRTAASPVAQDALVPGVLAAGG